jgi:hypothetical protein
LHTIDYLDFLSSCANAAPLAVAFLTTHINIRYNGFIGQSITNFRNG